MSFNPLGIAIFSSPCFPQNTYSIAYPLPKVNGDMENKLKENVSHPLING
jgi:hypothetical protein